MPAPKGNQNNRIDDPRSSTLVVRCKPSEKAAYVKAARKKKLSTWVIATLNEKAKVTTFARYKRPPQKP